MNTKNYLTFCLMIVVITTIFLPTARAAVTLDGVSSDPSVIAAGDEVILSVNFHDTGENFFDKTNQGAFRMSATLEPGDTVTKKYITVLDGAGNVGHLFSEQSWSKNYRIKVHNDAPIGTYQFKMVFQYYKDDKPYDNPQVAYFTLSVVKEGIILNLANIVTTPSEVRPGDNYVVLKTYLENSGRKDAKETEFTLDMPEGFSAPYANNNRVWIGYLTAGEQKEISTTFNVDENVTPGTYQFTAHLKYSDLDDNTNKKDVSFPVLVREKPVIVVTKSEGEILAGGTGEIRITLKNVGSETGENIDVRLLKESSQPFAFDARSDFIGTLKPGEEAEAVFSIKAQDDAAVKIHKFTALVRAKGDSNKGDDNVYTYSREATITVTGKAPNLRLLIGIALLVLVLLFIVASALGKGKRKKD